MNINKRNYVYFLVKIAFILLIFQGCEKEDSNVIPEDAPRLEDIAAEYVDILSSSEFGWKTLYKPSENSGAYTILMSFDQKGRLTIESDLMGFHKKQENVCYRVGGTIFPELVFETYCVWHYIYDQRGGDFEFLINNYKNNKIYLDYLNQSVTAPSLVLEKASSQDITDIEANKRTAQMLYDYIENEESYFKILKVSGNQDFEALIYFDYEINNVFIGYNTNEGFAHQYINYTYSGNSIILSETFNAGAFEINQLTFNGLDNQGNIVVSEAGKGNSGIIKSYETPPFEIKGSISEFNKYNFYYLYNYSDTLSSAMNELFENEQLIGVQLYRDYKLSTNDVMNSLTYIYLTTDGNYDFYSFDINFQSIGDDKIRFRYSGIYDDNIPPEIIEKSKSFFDIIFDSNGFTIVPFEGYFVLVSRKDSRFITIFVPVEV